MEPQRIRCVDFFELAKQRAETHLQEHGQRAVHIQLQKRRITKIEKNSFLKDVGLLNMSKRAGFEILIKREKTIEEQLITCGHEVAHTFEMHDEVRFFKPPYDTMQGIGPFHHDRENFCEDWARRWLENACLRDELTCLLQREEVWSISEECLAPLSDPPIIMYQPCSCKDCVR